MSQRKLLLIFFAVAASAQPFLALNSPSGKKPSSVEAASTIRMPVIEGNDLMFREMHNAANISQSRVLQIVQDHQGFLWFGTQYGLDRFDGSNFRTYVPEPGQANSLGGAYVYSLFKDRSGMLWVGCNQTLDRFDPTRDTFTHFRILSDGGRGSPATVVNISQDHLGELWLATGYGLYAFNPDTGTVTRHYTHDPGDASSLNSNDLRLAGEDRNGRLWVLERDALEELDRNSGKVKLRGKQTIHQYFVGNGLIYPSIRVLTIDHTGDLWVGTDRGINHVRGEAFLNDPTIAPLAQMKVWAIHEDADGGLWFGTRDNGLYRLRDGKLAHFTAQDGLASNAIYQILEDNAGHLWLSGPNGVALVNRHELDAQAESFPRHFALMFYSTADMAANTEIYGGTQSSGCITPQGDVWFPSNLGPLHIPALGRTALPPPPLFIQSVLAEGRPVAADGEVVLRPGNARLEFDFTPIRLRSQDGLRFRYMLEGFEKNWSAPTAARTADYTNLPAGRYRFRVQVFDASNPDAVSEASIGIVQRPFFYRTWWFIAGCLGLIMLLMFAIYQYRVKQVRERFEAVLEERSRLAREMHDTVIQGCTGVSALLEALSMESVDKQMQSR